MSQEKTLREKVFETCDVMQSQKIKITRAAVREHTGGSDRDLSKLIQEWRDSKAITVQNQPETLVQTDTNENEVQELYVANETSNGFTSTPNDDLSKVTRRGAERAAALIIGEDAVVEYLLENPEQLPEDLKQQVDIYRSRTAAAADKRQQQYNPNFFAQAAIAQLKRPA